MAWLYGVICAFDFIIFPWFVTIYYGRTAYHEWHPLTLQGGGMFHVAMGGIVGSAVWTRTQEKVAVWNSSSGAASDTVTAAGSGSAQKPSRAD